MAEQKPTANPSKDVREARLKAALKANLARRKAQARARMDEADNKGEDAK